MNLREGFWGHPPRSFEERVEHARSERHSNCIGTAIYLAGVYPVEHLQSPSLAYQVFLVDLPRVKHPELWGLVTWQRALVKPDSFSTQKISTPCVLTGHAALITCLNPLLVTDRPGDYQDFRESVPFKEVDAHYSTIEGHRYFLRYYRTPLQEEMRHIL